jgi:curved DNA-binding protein CbpA
MSTPLAGKFQDHYEVLGVDPKSDTDTIKRVYTRMAEKYRPENASSSDAGKFEAVNLAFEVLSDPLTRREFDKVVGIAEDHGAPRFSGPEFFEALAHQAGLRAALLCILYDRRRTKPFTPSLSMRHVENTLRAAIEDLTFVIWYLKQRGFIQNDDKSNLQITVEGMDFLENDQPSAEFVMPFMKPVAVAGPAIVAKPQATIRAEPAQVPEAEEREPLMKVISRNLALRVNHPQK